MWLPLQESLLLGTLHTVLFRLVHENGMGAAVHATGVRHVVLHPIRLTLADSPHHTRILAVLRRSWHSFMARPQLCCLLSGDRNLQSK